MSDFLTIDVGEHIEKKNGLKYLSWAWAWAEVLKIDPQATWEAVEFNGMPCCVLPDTSCMVKTIVTIKGHAKSCWLPVMDHKNKAIKGPDAFAINTALVRCLTKTIGMHGLGLYIYAGEDIPASASVQPPKTGAMADVLSELKPVPPEWLEYFVTLAEEVTMIFEDKGAKEAQHRIDLEELENEQRIQLEARLPSHVRSGLKK